MKNERWHNYKTLKLEGITVSPSPRMTNKILNWRWWQGSWNPTWALQEGVLWFISSVCPGQLQELQPLGGAVGKCWSTRNTKPLLKSTGYKWFLPLPPKETAPWNQNFKSLSLLKPLTTFSGCPGELKIPVYISHDTVPFSQKKFILLYTLYFIFVFFLRAHPQHMVVPRPWSDWSCSCWPMPQPQQRGIWALSMPTPQLVAKVDP